MIGTAFSVLIRLELSSPGIQYLQGDLQLTAHFIMSTLFHFIDACSLASKVANFCILWTICYMIIYHTTSLPGLFEPNKTFSAIVRYRNVQPIIPHKEAAHWEVVLHGDAKKLDTLVVDQKEPLAPSGSVCPGLAEVNSLKRTKVSADIPSDGSNLLAKTSPNEGNTIAQAPKQDNLRATTAPNRENGRTRDVTASIDKISVMLNFKKTKLTTIRFTNAFCHLWMKNIKILQRYLFSPIKDKITKGIAVPIFHPIWQTLNRTINWRSGVLVSIFTLIFILKNSLGLM